MSQPTPRLPHQTKDIFLTDGGTETWLMCSIPDDHIAPRRSTFFIARSVLEDIRKEKRDARSTA
jgi:hypothetical protein